ncbi:MAG TPA: CAP domain-containing protein [Polyangiaceae bacterium LLY-WYZ-15_(1-7)]|nr:CAP domain-containing protein [Polyangiaceae bacterium LLY-WYZ-15_(1-7)]HJL05177.1 CAP domain-containing protein [Polyangiaceae bacterium LLY-WYZ-15_(1-7)]HJL10532.1 CAP domain-containing protein [Polyangiaceae bacterium LLY-WYZ-15_(1-7)]HJL35863.1 CAP domain-containing protein [Polyangiaceae bacterium LLY-WYZ-15_(1-7)]
MRWWLCASFLLSLAACGDDDGGGTDPGGDAGATVLPSMCDDGPLAEPIAGCAPALLPSTGDPYEDCFRRINQFRAECQCLPPLARWEEGEGCADMHAEYDSTRDPHDGFRDRICPEGGNAQNECPGWPSVNATIDGCLQAMWDEGPGEDFNAHGHYINMSSTRYTMVACGFYTTPDGRVWAVQNFR